MSSGYDARTKLSFDGDAEQHKLFPFGRLIPLMAAWLLAGCVVLPTPAFVEEVELPENQVEPIEADESIVVLKPGRNLEEENDFSVCVREALQDRKPDVKLANLDTFRDAMFPWFEPGTYPDDPAALRQVLSTPIVQKRAADLNLRYLIAVGGDSFAEETLNLHPGVLPAGTVWGKGKTDLAAAVWDFKKAGSPGSITVDTYGYSGFAQWVIFFGIFYANTEALACEEVAKQIHLLVTGGGPKYATSGYSETGSH